MLASGGDLQRDLSLDDRAVTGLAADLDDPARRVELRPPCAACGRRRTSSRRRRPRSTRPRGRRPRLARPRRGTPRRRAHRLASPPPNGINFFAVAPMEGGHCGSQKEGSLAPSSRAIDRRRQLARTRRIGLGVAADRPECRQRQTQGFARRQGDAHVPSTRPSLERVCVARVQRASPDHCAEAGPVQARPRRRLGHLRQEARVRERVQAVRRAAPRPRGGSLQGA